MLRPRVYSQDPPLLAAALTGKREIVEELLDDSDVNARNRDGVNALLCAAANGHAEVVRLLLENWAQVDATDAKGRTALIVAAYNGHFNCVQMLIDKGADPLAADEQGVSALHAAVLKGYADIAGILLDEEPESKDFPTKEGRTPLHYAAARDQYDCVDSLVMKGANPNAKDFCGSTPLHVACECVGGKRRGGGDTEIQRSDR
jgi:ankyrin repeat protein